MIKKAYYYLYWRCYDFLSIFGDYDVGKKSAVLLTLLLLNPIAKLYFIFEFPYNVSLIIDQLILGGFWLFFLFFNFHIFDTNDKYLDIIKSFEDEKRKWKLFGRVCFVLYIFFMLYFLF